jgi:hypothetical protein
MRFDRLLSGVLLSAAAALLGCGGEPADADAAGASGDALVTEPHFAVEGRGESTKMSAVLDVVEGQEASRLALTGGDAADNLIAIYVTFHGVEAVVGSHVLAIGAVNDEVFAVGSIEGRVYQSEAGELRMSMSSDWHSKGEFEMTLALDAASPLALPPGAPEPAAPAPAELSLVGTFASEWRVNCRSPIPGFTGGHAVSDSPYCNALTF